MKDTLCLYHPPSLYLVFFGKNFYPEFLFVPFFRHPRTISRTGPRFISAITTHLAHAVQKQLKYYFTLSQFNKPCTSVLKLPSAKASNHQATCRLQTGGRWKGFRIKCYFSKVQMSFRKYLVRILLLFFSRQCLKNVCHFT